MIDVTASIFFEMNDNTHRRISPIILLKTLCAGLKIIFEKGGEVGKLNDLPTLEASIESNLSLDEETRYSLAKGLTTDLMDTKLAKEYFDAYKAATGETVDMTSKDHLNLKGISERGLQDPETIAYATRRHIVSKAIEQFLPDRKDVLAKLFELIVFDRDVPEDYESWEYRSLQWSVESIAYSDDDLYFKYLSPLLVRLFEDDSIGSLASRDTALQRMSSRKDRAIVPTLKRIYHQPEHPFHFSAELRLYTAVENFPDCFSEPEYLKFKETAKRVRARMLANSSS